MSRWLHATFRRFGEVDVQAYVYAHRYTYVCIHTEREREREIELLGKVLRVVKLYKDIRASIRFFQIPVGLIFSMLAYCPYD